MAKLSELLKQRKELKSKKPKFTRQDNHKKPKLGDKWRKPKGIQSKMRLSLRGYKRSPEIGWSSPKDVRGLSADGLVFKRVETLKDVESLDPKTDMAVVYSKVGQRKKTEIIKKLVEKKVLIKNYKDPEKYLKEVESKLQKSKKDKEDFKKKKEQKYKERAQKAKEKEEEEAKKQEEEKKESSEEDDGESLDKKVQEKEEMKKTQEDILTKKE